MKKIVFYSSNSKRRDKNSNCVVFPKWARQWDEMASRHPDCEITLVAQLSGRYFLDVYNGELAQSPERIRVKILPMEAGLREFLEAISSLQPDVAVAMPGPVSGYDWNCIRDAAIAEGLRARGIDAICYSTGAALDCFDKWRTHQKLTEGGFKVPNALYLHHELFVTDRLGNACTGNVYKEYILWEIENMSMPVVIKSTTGSSSMGIHVSKDFADARDYLLSDQLTEDVLIQQYLDGEEYGAEVHGDRGSYYVSPPFRIFSTVKGQLNDPLGKNTLKYGPILDAKLHTEELRAELKRMAEMIGFSGIMEVDLVLVRGEWYILEINNRWSGLTTLITASQGRLPYDVYMDEVTGAARDYNDPATLTYSCQFKMSKADAGVLEAISGERAVTSIIQYEIRLPGKEPFWFNDTVIGGFPTREALAEAFAGLQRKYMDQIPKELPEALAADIRRTSEAENGNSKDETEGQKS